jgi:hypothetical protein
MMNEERPTDLSALDPTQPQLTFARRVAAVRTAAAGSLRRRRERTPFAMLAHWSAPLLAALFLIMIVSAALLRSVPSDTAIDTVGTDEVADALSASAVLGDGDDQPAATPAEILLGGYEQQ